MWSILEHRSIAKTCKSLPLQAVKKYELWKDIVFRHGPDKLKEFPGFHDEKLKGDRAGQPLNPNVAKHKKVESRILKSQFYASLNDGLRLNFNSGSSNQATMRDL